MVGQKPWQSAYDLSGYKEITTADVITQNPFIRLVMTVSSSVITRLFLGFVVGQKPWQSYDFSGYKEITTADAITQDPFIRLVMTILSSVIARFFWALWVGKNRGNLYGAVAVKSR